jgi:putative transposase
LEADKLPPPLAIIPNTVVHELVNNYGLIAAEDLNAKGLARTKIAKSIYDVARGKFLTVM